MMIARAEGQGWCYEVIAQLDGFLVQARDIESGLVTGDEMTLFRTAPVALAYADMVAAADRFAAARLNDDEDLDQFEYVYQHELHRFAAIRERLHDEGVGAQMLRRDETGSSCRPTLH